MEMHEPEPADGREDGERVREFLADLDANGFVVIKGALPPDQVEQLRAGLKGARSARWQGGVNEVGTMWFSDLLERDPERYGALVAHPNVGPLLEALAGPQLQFRSMIAHTYPGPYTQTWHMDYYGYWDTPPQPLAVRGTAINTTFYLDDHNPDIGALEFLEKGHLTRPEGLTRDEVKGSEDNTFTQWCKSRPHVTIYPSAGDCVVFYSHLPHRGIKYAPEMERHNIVCHYQVNPFYDGVWFVSSQQPLPGSFPFGPEGTKLPSGTGGKPITRRVHR